VRFGRADPLKKAGVAFPLIPPPNRFAKICAGLEVGLLRGYEAVRCADTPDGPLGIRDVDFRNELGGGVLKKYCRQFGRPGRDNTLPLEQPQSRSGSTTDTPPSMPPSERCRTKSSPRRCSLSSGRRNDAATLEVSSPVRFTSGAGFGKTRIAND